MTSSSLTDWLTDSLTAMIHVVLKRFISLASQSLHPISKILTLVFCLSLKSMSWVDKTHCNWNHLEIVAVSSIMSSESGEVSCVLWESGKISHQPLEAEDMSHKPLEGGEHFPSCVFTVLGLALQPGGMPLPEVIIQWECFWFEWFGWCCWLGQ